MGRRDMILRSALGAMNTTIKALTVLAGTAGLVMLSLSPALADPTDPTPPAAVVDSLSPGGDAFNQAVELNATVPSTGNVDSATVAPSTTTFGFPHLNYSWVPSTSTSAVLNSQDFDAKRGTRWVAVEYMGGTPVSAIQVDNAGRFVQLDGWLPEDVQILAGLPDGATLVTTSLWGDELYRMNSKNSELVALTPAAKALVGSAPVSAAAFRDAKNEQQKTELAKQPTGLPSDAVGAAAPVGATSTTQSQALVSWPGIGAATAGLLLIGGAAYTWGRRKRRHEHAAV